MEMHSQDIGLISEALSKAQSMMSGALEDCNNPFFKSSYADLTSVWKACKRPLSENGLSVVQSVIYENGVPFIVSMLCHTSGQWFKSIMQVKPQKEDMQALGSAITYSRRFSLAALVGVYPKGDDDDGENSLDRNKAVEPVVLLIPEKFDPAKVNEYVTHLAKHYGKAESTIKKQAMDNPTGFYETFEEWLSKQK